MLQDLDKYKRNFIFDISSGSVSGAVVFLKKDSEKPIIEFSIKKNIQFSSGDNLEELKKKTQKALSEVCQKIIDFKKTSFGKFSFKSASVFFSSPWINFKNYSLIDDRDKSFQIDKKYLENFLKSEIEEKNNDLIKSQIISVRANGYNTNLQNLEGQKVSKIDLSMIDTLMNFADQESIKKTINEYFSFEKINLISFLPVFFNQIKNIYDLEDDFIFLDVTGSITDFGIFANGKIRNISSFPIGRKHILEKIVVDKIALDLNLANSILTMYFRKELEDNLKNKIQKIIIEFGEKFKNNIKEILEEFKTFNIPLNVFTIASKETKFLMKELNLFSGQQKLLFIDEKMIRNFIEGDEKYFDPFLALEAEYIFSI